MSLYWKNMLLLKAARRLLPIGNYPLPMKIKGKWYWINDSARSNTREIVLSEIEGPSKFYKIPEKIPTGAIIFDIGAHVGLFSLPLARENPQAIFICIEPNKANYKNLWKNRERLGLTNVQIVNAGIWDKETELISLQDKKNTGGSRSIAIDHTPQLPVVKGYPLKHFTDWGSQKIWLMKMDCEGAEFKAIRFFHDVDNVQRFIGEIHCGKGDDKALDKILQRIPKFRYVKLDGNQKTVIKNW